MRLPILQHLQPVLEAAQEAVGVAQLDHRAGRQRTPALECAQRVEQGRGLQAAILAAAHQLQRLHDELDLADTARPELHVAREIAPLHFAFDEALHFAQRLEHAEIEIAAIDERPHGARLDLDVGVCRGDRARLHPGVALPCAAVAQEIILERRKPRDQGSAVTERTQAHVDPENESVDRARVEEANQRLTEPREEFLVRNRARAVGVTELGEQEHEIDVGGEIELAATELAHADHHEWLRRARGPARRTEAGDETRRRVAARRFDRGIGEGRKFREGFLDPGPAGKIAPRDAHHFAAAPAPDPCLEFRLRGVRAFGQRGGGEIRRRTRREQRAGEQRRNHGRITHARFRNEIAGREHARQRLEHGGWRGRQRLRDGRDFLQFAQHFRGAGRHGFNSDQGHQASGIRISDSGCRRDR